MSAQRREGARDPAERRRRELVVAGEPALRIEERRLVDNPYLPRQIVIRGPEPDDVPGDEDGGLVEAWASATGQEPVGQGRADPRRRRIATFLLVVLVLGSFSGVVVALPRVVDPAVVLVVVVALVAAAAMLRARGRRRGSS